MKHCVTTKNSSVLGIRYTKLFIYLAVFSLSLHYTLAENCPVLPGGYKTINFKASETKYLYPGSYPTYPPAGSEKASTIGYFNFNGINNIPSSNKASVTISPTLNGTNYGKVLLNVWALDFGAGTSLKIYKGLEKDKNLIDDITTDNYKSKVGKEYVIDGNVTLVFYGNTASKNSSNLIRFITGDVLFKTCTNGRSGLVWKEFIKANSYVIVDDAESELENFGSQGYLFLPACVAYFDAQKNFVRTESAFCLNQKLYAPTPGYHFFPGQVSFTLKSTDKYDIDNNGSFNDADELKIARIIWLIQKGNNTTSHADKKKIQDAIWTTQTSAVNATFTNGSWEKQAQDAVKTIPSPSEPDFAINLALGEKATAVVRKETIKIEIPFSWPKTQPGQTNVVKLDIPANVTVTAVTGGTLSGYNLTITSSKATLTLSASQVGVYDIKASYDNPGYYNIKNLQVYKSCSSKYQDFLHLGEENLAIPFRSIKLEWIGDPLPVKLISFDAKAENNTVNLAWRTAEEINFSHFEIEKSPDAKNWNKISEVPGDQSLNYFFVDKDIINQSVYYRLKMVDLDESYAYSGIKRVRTEGLLAQVSLYPNPVSSHLYFANLDLQNVKNLSLYDQTGVIQMHSAGIKENNIALDRLTSGMYIVKIEMQNGELINKKILVQK